MSNLVDNKVEYWAVSDLKPYANNAKVHNRSHVQKLASIIKEDGWSDGHAIQVDKDGVIIAGHGRRLAAIELGMDKVPVIVRDDLDEAGVKRMRLTENEASSTDYDTELKAMEIRELLDDGVDLSGMFDDRDLEFSTEKLDEMNLEAFAFDLEEQVQEQSHDTSNALKERAEQDYSIGKILPGKVSAAQQRVIMRFKACAEEETQLEDLDAVVAYMGSIVAPEVSLV